MFKKLKHWLIWKKVAWLYKQPWTGLFKLEVVDGEPTGVIYRIVANDWQYWMEFADSQKATDAILFARWKRIRNKRRIKPVEYYYFP